VSNNTARKKRAGQIDGFRLSETQVRRAMVFSESITFDDEEIRRVAVSPAPFVRNVEDSEFLEKLRSSDPAAFEKLVDLYSGDVYALLYRLTGNAEEASDLVQDTFLRAVRSIKSFRGDSELKTWLIRIAINESRNRFRWWKRRRRHLTISLDATIGDSDSTLSENIADRSLSPEETALNREREYAIEAALVDIPDVYREAIVLCDIEGLSYEETAASLGVRVGTVKSRISRGREELRRRLKDF
jgi:RNA polymerase sigma-70 factor (ECF subfamily)